MYPSRRNEDKSEVETQSQTMASDIFRNEGTTTNNNGQVRTIQGDQ